MNFMSTEPLVREVHTSVDWLNDQRFPLREAGEINCDDSNIYICCEHTHNVSNKDDMHNNQRHTRWLV